MINSHAFDYINVLEKAADASWTRYNVISNNIANNTTPGFKRKDVNFEDYLVQELTSGGTQSLRQKIAGVDLDNITPTTYVDYSQLSYRLDGNNVDIDTENVEAASAQIKYNTLLDSITHEFNMYKAALAK